MNNPPASVDTVSATAPERIWLQVSDESIDCELEFPVRHDDITWCQDSTLECEVEYIRADLAQEYLDHLRSLADELEHQRDDLADYG